MDKERHTIKIKDLPIRERMNLCLAGRKELDWRGFEPLLQ